MNDNVKFKVPIAAYMINTLFSTSLKHPEHYLPLSVGTGMLTVWSSSQTGGTAETSIFTSPSTNINTLSKFITFSRIHQLLSAYICTSFNPD